MEYNESTEEDYQVTYLDSATNVVDTVKSTQLKLTTGVGPKLETKISATVGKDDLTNGAEVKAGEVIKYKVEVANTGTETASNVTISASVPENTTYVQAKEEFEYEGASYYKEIADKTQEEQTIEKIEPNETKTIEYEVRVNKNITTPTTITNKGVAKIDDVITESDELTTILNSGDIRVSLKRITDGEVILTKGNHVEYYAFIENISSQAKENVKLKTNISDGFSVEELSLITGSVDEELSNTDNLQSEEIEYSNEIDIGDFQAGEMKVLYYSVTLDKNGALDLSCIVNEGNNSYRSNVWTEKVGYLDAKISMTSNAKKYVKEGDNIEYTIVVKNTGDQEMLGLYVVDTISTSLRINSITVDGEQIEKPKYNELNQEINFASNEEKTIVINTTVKASVNNTTERIISNKAIAEYMGEEIASTEEIIHIVEPVEQNDENSSNSTDASKTSGNKIISGIAWYDANADGKKDENEQTLSGIQVKLLNAETNELVKTASGDELSATTAENGMYILNNIANGKYIVVFNYNTNLYALTKYQVQGIDESKNSNATMNEISINGSTQKIASTDIIQIENNNIADINIGLIQLQNFDLQLDKYISKVIVQNSSGTSTTEYTDAKMAKAEICWRSARIC